MKFLKLGLLPSLMLFTACSAGSVYKTGQGFEAAGALGAPVLVPGLIMKSASGNVISEEVDKRLPKGSTEQVIFGEYSPKIQEIVDNPPIRVAVPNSTMLRWENNVKMINGIETVISVGNTAPDRMALRQLIYLAQTDALNKRFGSEPEDIEKNLERWNQCRFIGATYEKDGNKVYVSSNRCQPIKILTEKELRAEARSMLRERMRIRKEVMDR